MGPSLADQRKSLMRKRLRSALLGMTQRMRKQQSDQVCRRLLQDHRYQSARCVLGYAALPSEVQTITFLRECLKSGRCLCLPRVAKDGRGLEIYRVEDLKKDLHAGKFGIMEPRRIKRRKVQLRGVDLIIVPGLGFDCRGGRLGRGKGFYDRLLKRAKHIPKIGLAYREQMVRQIPMAARDVYLDEIIASVK